MFLRYLVMIISYLIVTQGVLLSQSRVGLNTTSWSGVSELNYNPAVANNMHLWDISLGSMTIYYGSNHYKANIGRMFNSFGAGLLSPDFTSRNFFAIGDPQGYEKSISIDRYSVVQGPGSFIIPLGREKPNEGQRKRAVLGFSWHFNNLMNVREGDNRLLDPFIFGPNSDNTIYQNQSVSAKSHAWVDYGITYSQVLVDKHKHLFKGGLTMKLIHGQGFVSLEADDMASIIQQDGYHLGFVTQGGELRSSNNMIFDAEENFNMASGTSKISVASDLGFIYEFRPKRDNYYYTMDNNDSLLRPDVAHHTLAIGLSVLDIGKARYQNPNNITLVDGTSYFVPIDDHIGGNAINDEYIGIYGLNSVLGTQGVNNNNAAQTVALPTRVNIFVDLNTGAKGLGFNFSGTISPKIGEGKNGARYPHSFTFTPRIENRWFGVYLPLSITEVSGFSFGTSARIGPISIGVSNIAAMFNNKNSNTTFFVGARIFIPERRAKDKDKDGVSNNYDECEGQIGTWYAKGCPDSDNDGIADKFDECIYEPGPRITNGCPDTDQDGILDKDDSCRLERGLPEFNGCPDTDGDGIMDKEDSCKTLKGLPQNFGCPDTDGDGIVDHLDGCPNDPQGPNGRNGCPDTDGDGVIDKYDKCIELPGLPENEGCPDSDKDGFFDHEDDCPYDPGVEEHHGCPDTDGDGVRDKDDDCPDVKGPKENAGCPLEGDGSGALLSPGENDLANRTEGITTVISFLPHDVKPTQDPDTRKTPMALVEEFVASIDPNSIVVVQGHTGGKAAEGGNFDWMDISLARANAVVELLIEAGVEKSRIVVEHYGNTQPLIVSTDWKKDRLNRRVMLIEMK